MHKNACPQFSIFYLVIEQISSDFWFVKQNLE